MSDCCADPCGSSKPPVDPRYRRVLWVALVINAIMFGVELWSGLIAGSVSLLTDAVDFLGDASNYALSLFVLALAPGWRSRAVLVKGLMMGVYGVFVLGKAIWSAAAGVIPEPVTMSLIGFLALMANVSVAVNWPALLLLWIPFHCAADASYRLYRIDDSDALISSEIKQIGIAGDDQMRVGSKCAS